MVNLCVSPLTLDFLKATIFQLVYELDLALTHESS